MKELREDKLIRKILDKNYFHVSTTMKEDGSFSWKKGKASFSLAKLVIVAI